MMNGLMMALFGSATSGVKPQSFFSTDLYTGDSSARTITNGIDLTADGGLVWIKARSTTTGHRLVDTVRGSALSLESNSTAAEATESGGLTAFNADGFNIGSDVDYNGSGETFVAWTFRQATNFFDVVAYTGDGLSGRAINHNLGIKPGIIIVKRRSNIDNWAVYHQSRGVTKLLLLSSASSEITNSEFHTEPTDSVFYVGSGTLLNASGNNYIAYLFAHDTDSSGIIQAGQYTGNGSSNGPVITLGWQPQWLLIKVATGSTGSWYIMDTERGIVGGGSDPYLRANINNAEFVSDQLVDLTANGFQIKNSAAPVNANGESYIYMAIRKPT